MSFDPFNDLGHRYDLAERGYKLKRYPCGGLSHASVDAALALRDNLGKHFSAISSIKVGVTKNAGQRISDNILRLSRMPSSACPT